MSRSLRVVIPGRPANLGNARMHWAEKARTVALERLAAQRIATSEAVVHAFPKASGRRRVSVVLELAGQSMDTDNCYSAAKPYVDGLVDAALLIDDAPQWCELTVSQRKTRYRNTQQVVLEVHDGD